MNEQTIDNTVEVRQTSGVRLPKVMIFEYGLERKRSRALEYREMFRDKAEADVHYWVPNESLGVELKFHVFKASEHRLDKNLEAKIQETNPDLIITELEWDYKISGKLDYSFIRALKDHAKLKSIPVVVCSLLTVRKEDDDSNEAIHAGAAAVYGKHPMPSAEDFLQYARK